MKILVTGSSGYVGHALMPILASEFVPYGIDRSGGRYTTMIADIVDLLPSCFVGCSEDYVVVHLAACRSDFGVEASTYFYDNVRATEQFLANLVSQPPKRFVHCSSVAAIPGRTLSFDRSLSCDDAYRVTKRLQSELIMEWCGNHAVEYVELLPSAIYSQEMRRDTNIGILQRLARVVPVLPAVDVRKSTTELGSFTRMLARAVYKLKPGRYLCIDSPVKTVSEIILDNSIGYVTLIRVPGLQTLLYSLSYITVGLSKLLGVDLRLTPSRVKKLFEDTSFSQEPGLDRISFGQGD